MKIRKKSTNREKHNASAITIDDLDSKIKRCTEKDTENNDVKLKVSNTRNRI